MGTPQALPKHVAENRRYWDDYAPAWVARGEDAWGQTEPRWGTWLVPESKLEMLPDTMTGIRAVELELVHGSAEATPFASGSFDFAISEYGAAIWCDPYVWIPEAYRLLRPGGRLVFLGHHPLAAVCSPPDGGTLVERLVNPYFELHNMDWTQAEVDPGGIEFNLPISRWFEVFREVGFQVEDYREPRPSSPDLDSGFHQHALWAYRFPGEQAWKLRKP